jgi:branched-chain amino acid transport system ATP-binding protein
MSAPGPTIVEVTGLTKRFGGLLAVDTVDFTLQGGEILGLIGPNGSGKSTTMKLLMGLERPSAGSIRMDGQEIAGQAAHRIAQRGIGIVFQHSRPLERQTVLESIILGLLPDSLVRLSIARSVKDRAREIAASVGLSEFLDRRPSTLSFADLRRLELAKTVARAPRVILIDEPFAGLTASECETFDILFDRLRREGKAILLVDHNVKRVAALVDRVIALSLGKQIAHGSPAQVMSDETVQRVYLGTALDKPPRAPRTREPATPLLSVRSISLFYGKARALDDVSFDIGAGEFVGIVGINGAGKTSLFNGISGLLPYRGEILWNGVPLAQRKPAQIARAGIIHCPETRELFGDMTVRENLDLGANRQSRRDAAERLEWLFELFPVLSARQSQSARTLSGGEQQMLAIGRALMARPKLLILDEPTLGLAPVVLGHLSDALETLRKTTDISFLLGEQNVFFALPHADRILVLDHARIVWQGPPDRFAVEAADLFLGMRPVSPVLQGQR